MKFLLDTNVLVCSFDTRDSSKCTRARSLLEQALGNRSAALPSQALSEYSNVLLRKFGVSPDLVHREIERFQLLFPVYPLTAAVVLEALRGVRDHSFSYFDSQIWATSRLNQVPVVLTEDFSSGATVEGVTFINPFRPDFDLSNLA